LNSIINRKYLMAINDMTFRWTFKFIFDRGRKTCWESSIKMPYLRYEKKKYYVFLTEK